MKKNCQITVIMSCYNCERTINKAIDSILAQTYKDWVMICCDDGSTDGTYQILKDYKSRYPEKFVILRNERNLKLAHSLNKCLCCVKTDYVARMDADDESLPDRFEKQMDYLKNNPECIVCGTTILIKSELSGKQYISTNEELPNRFTLHKHTPFNHATILCRKQMYDLLGGYSEEKTAVRCEDKELWFRFFANNLVGANLSEPLYTLTEDKASIYRSTRRNRWNSFITEISGYKLLRYPWYWYIKPVVNLLKILVPKRLIVFYYKVFR